MKAGSETQVVRLEQFTDSTPLINKPEALRQRWKEDGVLFFRNVMDPKKIAWAEQKYRGALAAEGLIDPNVERPVWTGKAPQTRRPCDALGTEVWHELVKQPDLNTILRDIMEGEPVWIPIAAHRSQLPTGPIEPGDDLFAGRHQDGFVNEGIEFIICWMPIRDADMNRGGFAVAVGQHNRGWLHDRREKNNAVPADAIPPDAWRSADFRVGDVLIFGFACPHSTMPNPSDEIRMSLDVRAVPDWAGKPVTGTVTALKGTEVLIESDEGELVSVQVTEKTHIRDMAKIGMSINELGDLAYPGSRVLAMIGEDGVASVLRRNFY